MPKLNKPLLTFTLFAAPLGLAVAAMPPATVNSSSLTSHPLAWLSIAIFIAAYILVMTEEITRLPKSKPVILSAGLIWLCIGIMAPHYGISHEQLKIALLSDLDQYGSLALFLFAAMTYINSLESANVFAVIRTWLVRQNFTYRQLFWVTGFMAFFLSAVADNLTTALVLGAVVMAVGKDNPNFVSISMVSIVCAANAGGVFSPFGDITTLMVWQSGNLDFLEFLVLFWPAFTMFVVPALIMSFFISGQPQKVNQDTIKLKRGAKRAIALFIFTIGMAVSFEYFLGIPPFIGMMTGLSLLMLHVYSLRTTQKPDESADQVLNDIARMEWDTLLFFYGVMFSVGGLAFIGYLDVVSTALYTQWDTASANITLGLISALVDNIPVMFAVLTMDPTMPDFQWLLICLTCGIGGSLLSIGSAAGVALMGSAKGQYTFLSHLKWTPVVAVGFSLSVWVHYLVNG